MSVKNGGEKSLHPKGNEKVYSYILLRSNFQEFVMCSEYILNLYLTCRWKFSLRVATVDVVMPCLTTCYIDSPQRMPPNHDDKHYNFAYIILEFVIMKMWQQPTNCKR